MITLILLSSKLLGQNSILNLNNNIPQSPVYVSNDFYFSGWIACFLLQGLFAIRGLMCEKATVHYQNCLMLKIKLNFVFLCALFTSSFLLIAIFVNNSEYKIGLRALIVLLNFVFLKSKPWHLTGFAL